MRRSKLRHYKELRGQELAEDVVDGLRIGLAAGGLHDLADEMLEYTFVPGFEFGDVRRVFGDNFPGGPFDSGIVIDLRETLGSDDVICGASSFCHLT